jgi:ATP-dependent Clp protease ATP-binding subunit ClpB
MNETDWEIFTEEARAVTLRSQEILFQHRNPIMQPEHLLLAVIDASDPILTYIFDSLTIDIRSIKTQLEEVIQDFPQVSLKNVNERPIFVTASVMQSMDLAVQESKRSHVNGVTVTHIFLGLITSFWEPNSERNMLSAYILETSGLTPENVKRILSKKGRPKTKNKQE